MTTTPKQPTPYNRHNRYNVKQIRCYQLINLIINNKEVSTEYSVTPPVSLQEAYSKIASSGWDFDIGDLDFNTSRFSSAHLAGGARFLYAMDFCRMCRKPVGGSSYEITAPQVFPSSDGSTVLFTDARFSRLATTYVAHGAMAVFGAKRAVVYDNMTADARLMGVIDWDESIWDEIVSRIEALDKCE